MIVIQQSEKIRSRSPAKTGGTCSIIFDFIVLMRDGTHIFKNFKLGFIQNHSGCSIKM